MPNTMTFEQSATILNAIQQQVTGQAAQTPIDLTGFVSTANTVLQTGYDPIYNAINQVLSRTIFSTRPYRRKFGLAEVSESAYGNHVRKLAVADKDIEDDDRYKWPVAYDAGQTPPSGDGQSVDMYIQKKSDILQTNFYGANVWSDWYTIYKDQIDCAFTGPDEFGRFISLITGEQANKIEQIREDMGRTCVINAIIGTIEQNDTATSMFDLGHRTIPLLTLYNTYTGLSLTATDVFQPANFTPFVRWAFSVIENVSDLMSERSELFQVVVNNKHVMRHTPKDRQKIFVASQFGNMISTMVRVQNFNDGFMVLPSGVKMESVTFWQNITDPLTIAGKGSWIDSTGAVADSATAITSDPVIAYLFDDEHLGYATTQSWSSVTPFNSRGGYSNTWLHETQRLYNDHTEKSVVFLLA